MKKFNKKGTKAHLIQIFLFFTLLCINFIIKHILKYIIFIIFDFLNAILINYERKMRIFDSYYNLKMTHPKVIIYSNNEFRGKKKIE